MDIILFNKVFSNGILKKLVFRQVHHIFVDILKKTTFKWNEVLQSRYVLAGNGYLTHLKEYYSVNNTDLKFNRKDTVLLNAFKSQSLDIIKYIIEELNYDYNTYGCYDNSFHYFDGFDILYIASIYGNIEIIKYIDSLKQKNNNNSSNWNYYESFKVAPLSNDIKVLQYIYDKLIENHQTPDEYQIGCSICSSLSVGRIDFVEWLITLSKTSINLGEIKYVKNAIKSGKVDVVQYCLTKYTLQSSDDTNLITEAAQYGYLDIVKWLYSNNICEIKNCAFENASFSNHWEVIKWLYEKSRNTFSDIKTVLNAAMDGQFDVYRLLIQSNGFSPDALQVLARETIRYASMGGNLELLKWIQENRTEFSAGNAFACAALNGSLEAIKWLHENGAEGCTTNSMNYAARKGYLEVIKWLHENRTEGCTSHAVDSAALYGHSDVVKYILQNRTEGCTVAAMNFAADGSHLDLLKWLHHNRTEGCTVNAMDNAAANGYFEIVKWLHENRTEGCTDAAMDLAASRGNLDMVKWLHENRTEGCSDCAIDDAALNGHLDIVKWLHENRTEGCTTEAMDSAASNGHLNVVKWLHFNRTEGCSNWAMDNAAIKGHFETAKWLYYNRTEGFTQNGIDVANDNGHLDICNWLNSVPNPRIDI